MYFSKTALFELTRRFLSAKVEDISVAEISELQKMVRDHNELYYIESEPIVDDGQYDSLFRLLREAEEEHGIYDSKSPTNRIDVLVSRQFQKGLHLVPMISLDNTYNAQEVIEFGARVKKYLDEEDADVKFACILELKFDGLGMSVLYRE